MLRKARVLARAYPGPLACAVFTALIVIAPACDARSQQQPAQPAPQSFQPSDQWTKLPKMVIERQFAGPLQDTVIQRLRDPVDGTICYIYLPITAPHSPPTPTGFVQYGPNMIGSINCIAGMAAAKPTARRP